MVDVCPCAVVADVVSSAAESVVSGRISEISAEFAASVRGRFSVVDAGREPASFGERGASVMEGSWVTFLRAEAEWAAVFEVVWRFGFRDDVVMPKWAVKASSSAVSRVATLASEERSALSRPFLRAPRAERAAVERGGDDVDEGEDGAEDSSLPRFLDLVLRCPESMDASGEAGGPADPEGGSRERVVTGIGASDRELVRESYSLRKKKRVDKSVDKNNKGRG